MPAPNAAGAIIISICFTLGVSLGHGRRSAMPARRKAITSQANWITPAPETPIAKACPGVSVH